MMNKIMRGRNSSSTSQKVAKYPELSTIETPSCNLFTQLIYVVLINYFLSGCMQCLILRRWVKFCIVSELLRYHHGEITLKECNERIYDIEKVSVEVFGKRAGSWFTDSDGGAWIAGKGSFQDLYAHIHSSHPSIVGGCMLSIKNRDHTSLKEFGKKILVCARVNSFKRTMENPYIFYQRMTSGLSKLGTESMRSN
ncbi:hypothetical protein WICPIJ_006383 [Wickerhamomyces pijperi]|uniref:Uncharacterized protein n=1 Tax=Wickerhamomyces pijperi TaxID=599730 RepID=A0A9P8TKX5_WICPI|nr:hypothetical protein WICPIJ_006383 [Wickerhamomyces pijperi]